MKKILFLIASCGLLASNALHSKSISARQAIALVTDFGQLDATTAQLKKLANTTAIAFKSCAKIKGQKQINCLASALNQLASLISSTSIGLLGYTGKDKVQHLAIIGDLAQVAGKDAAVLAFSKRLTGTAGDIKTLATLLNPELSTAKTKPVALVIDESALASDLDEDLDDLEL